MNNKEKDYFIENLAMLLTSGMGIIAALKSVKEELKSRALKKKMDSLIEEIEGGSSIWRALDKTKMVSPHVTSLIKIGEESGRLSENLAVIVAEQQKERLLKSKIKSAMMYPILVLSLTLVIGLGIAWFILPRLATVFAQLKINLPIFTRALIGLGAFLGEYGHIVIPIVLIILAVLFYFIFFFKGTKFIGEAIVFHIPGVGNLMREVELARLGYILGTLLEAGLNINIALGSLAQITPFRRYKNFYLYIKDGVEEGNSFQKCFASYPHSNKLIPSPIQHMIVAGEMSGNLSGTLLKMGQIFENKTEVTTKNLTVLLEPILLFVVWLGVVGVALAIILPIYSLIGGLNT